MRRGNQKFSNVNVRQYGTFIIQDSSLRHTICVFILFFEFLVSFLASYQTKNQFWWSYTAWTVCSRLLNILVEFQFDHGLFFLTNIRPDEVKTANKLSLLNLFISKNPTFWRIDASHNTLNTGSDNLELITLITFTILFEFINNVFFSCGFSTQVILHVTL